ncbi:VWA domain-containing protein [Rheinheimera sp.]|uniref:vWA domain-containing protein n=1 Tax=Rheinheimera sp. TaxID=1869214 RepID=UPI00261BCA8A|nr:VWA domain-containing protein [Rheinheimera sp.]MCA1928790.1 VWA domain-containing protein [Rheinheimera sp.]
MLISFFLTLRKYGLKSSITELMDLLKALQQQIIFASTDDFYLLSRLCLVKDEGQYDKFDRAFAEYFDGVDVLDLASLIPDHWLLPGLIRQLSDEDKAKLASLGGLEQLLEQFKQRLKEQQEKHAGGNKWIGTGGSSPFGAYGFHPEGIRVGQQGSGQRRAVKVWDKRDFKEFDQNAELNHRAMQLALRQLRRFARTGLATELDLNGTIKATAQQAGWLDLQFQSERHNAVKVLMFFDIGGSMDDYIHECEQLFAAARTEFKHLEFFYFHNCVYEQVWRTHQRRHADAVSITQLLQTYHSDYKVIFVGDATTGPYEITYPGGSVEHFNAESGEVWLKRLLAHFTNAVWLNPQPQAWWSHYHSIEILQKLMQNQMYGMTLDGLSGAIRHLSKRH